VEESNAGVSVRKPGLSVTIVDEVVLTLQASARYTQDTTGQTQAALQATWR
jgi:hypothetical protein